MKVPQLLRAFTLFAFLFHSATAFHKGYGETETFVVVTTKKPVTEWQTIQDALYDGGEPPKQRGLRASSFIKCCKLCEGWPPGQCFIWSASYDCRSWTPSKCARRELEEDESKNDDDDGGDVEDNGTVSCKEYEEELAKLQNARLLYKDWTAMEASKMKCVPVEIDPATSGTSTTLAPAPPSKAPVSTPVQSPVSAPAKAPVQAPVVPAPAPAPVKAPVKTYYYGAQTPTSPTDSKYSGHWWWWSW